MHWSCKSDSRLLEGLVREFGRTQAEVEFNQPSSVLNSVFFICAYRSSIVDSHHHVLRGFEDRVDSTSISIQPLERNDAGRIVSDVLQRSIADCRELTDLIYCRTRGNPFYIGRVYPQTSFVMQMLSLMDSSELISFSFKKKQWEWDIQRIKEMAVFDDFADFLAHRVFERRFSKFPYL